MDPVFWKQLAALDPASVCRRSDAIQDRDGYRLQVLDGEYLVVPGEQRISRSRVGADPRRQPVAVSDELELIIVHYLLNARDLPLSGEWVGLQELGSGNRFFTSHVPDFGQLLPLFSAQPEAVVRAAQSLGGRRLEYGDLAVEFQMLPRLPIAFVYWAASDEFAADASVLFDRTAEQHLPLDVMSAVVQEAIQRLAEVTRQEIASGSGR